MRAQIQTKKEACDRYGWAYETYKKHEDDRQIDSDMAFKYARAYGVDPGWIMWGIHPPKWDETPHSSGAEANLRSVPKLTPELAVQLPDAFVKLRRLQPETMLDHGSDIGPKSYSMEIEDESMVAKPADRDSFAPGDLVVFDADRQPMPGDFVLAHVEGEPEAIFRKYRLRSVGKIGPAYELAPLNPDFGAALIAPGGRSARIIGLMIRHIKKYATEA